ncbi:MAG: hypothetical protein H7Y60_06465 [Rhodospirillaceae bacterium]|nr:hypothetical protein [Rhodospirillales bacterium]
MLAGDLDLAVEYLAGDMAAANTRFQASGTAWPLTPRARRPARYHAAPCQPARIARP